MSTPQKSQRELADCINRSAPLDDIRILVACGAKVNEPVTQGLRPLHYAAYQRYTEAMKLLLVRGADPNVMDDAGYTPLHLCAERGYLDLMKLLLKHGARVCFTKVLNDDRPYGNPPRASPADEPLRLAIKNGHYLSAYFLLQNGADPNARYFLGSEINLISPLNLRFLELLLSHGSNPDAMDRTGLTPLMKACRHPEGLDAAYLLLSYGADVNAMSPPQNDSRTVLHYAVLSGNVNIVKMILAHGSAVRYPSDYHKSTPLDFAVLTGNIEILKLLIESGADVNSGSEIIGSSLHIAVAEKIDNKFEIIRLLLENGANPNSVSVFNEGPLLRPPLAEYFNASEQPSIELVRMLLRYGARVILKHQFHHPLGILKTIHRLHLGLTPEVLTLILEAAEEFSIGSIRRSLMLTDDHKELLLQRALTPPTMKHLARLAVRHQLSSGKNLPKVVFKLPVPETLKTYLLFDP